MGRSVAKATLKKPAPAKAGKKSAKSTARVAGKPGKKPSRPSTVKGSVARARAMPPAKRVTAKPAAPPQKPKMKVKPATVNAKTGAAKSPTVKATSEKATAVKSPAIKLAAAKAALKRPTALSTVAKPSASKTGQKVIAAIAPKTVSSAKASKLGTAPAVSTQRNAVKKVDAPMKKSKDAERKGIAIPPPIPTDTKPSKNIAGLRTSELEHFRDMLLAKRRELVGDMSSMEREALQRGGNSNLSNLPLHMADMGTDNYEQEFTLGLMEKDRNLLREINNALAKVQDGTYGMCEGTRLPISKARLEAQPWARYSIEHARKLEQRMGR